VGVDKTHQRHILLLLIEWSSAFLIAWLSFSQRY